jgi:exodeoxyribonuclease VII small subunit
MKTTQMTYRQSMGELKTIVDRLRECEDVDVDELVTDVARAKELIEFCGAKVRKADAAIKGIVSELQVAEGERPALATNEVASRNGREENDIPF